MQNILTHGNSLMSTVNEIAKKMWAQHLVNQGRRASYYALKSMTEAQLKDIGVNRCDIRQRVFDIHS